MVRQLTGLSGLAYQQGAFGDGSRDFATPEQRQGNAADPRHEQLGERAKPYSWESQMTPGGSHGPYGPENGLLDTEDWVLMDGGTSDQDPTMDLTPYETGAGPFPQGVMSGPIAGIDPDSISNQLEQSYAIHGIKTNAGLKALHPVQAFGIQNDQWSEIWQVDPNNSDLVPIPKQMMSSGFMWGTRDRTQSMARQNEFGFDGRHMHRRFATGSIPGNTMWMRPGGRPLVKSFAGPARPATGPDSPFYGDDLGTAFGIDGAILQNVPTEYVAPPTPNLQKPGDNANDSVVEWY